MTALFADTFYWIALIDFTDSALSLALASECADSPIVTTDEVLIECLTFFDTTPEQMRRNAVIRSRSPFLATPLAWLASRARSA